MCLHNLRKGNRVVAKVQLDYRGLKCPMPTMKFNQYVTTGNIHPGDVVEIVADCTTFEHDIRRWCEISKKMLVKFYIDDERKIAQIQF